MYLDTYIQALREALRRHTDPSKHIPFDVNDAENVLWFLELLRKREGYNVERPERREQRRERNYEDPWKTAYDAQGSYRAYEHQFTAEEMARMREDMARMKEEVFRQAYSAYSGKRYEANWGRSKSYTWEEMFKEEPKRRQKTSSTNFGKRPWHEVLGLRADATLAQRQKAYRSLAQQYHPDRPGGNAEKMSELNSIKKEAGL